VSFRRLYKQTDSAQRTRSKTLIHSHEDMEYMDIGCAMMGRINAQVTSDYFVIPAKAGQKREVR